MRHRNGSEHSLGTRATVPDPEDSGSRTTTRRSTIATPCADEKTNAEPFRSAAPNPRTQGEGS